MNQSCIEVFEQDPFAPGPKLQNMFACSIALIRRDAFFHAVCSHSGSKHALKFQTTKNKFQVFFLNRNRFLKSINNSPTIILNKPLNEITSRHISQNRLVFLHCLGVNFQVLGTEHPDFIEGHDAAAANTVELFEVMVPRVVSFESKS